MKIRPDMTLSEVLRSYPNLKQILLKYGICDCCGGNLSLEKHAQQKNLDTGKLIKELEQYI
jgi:iron-sulfur cluster repair protein YtfE (RIC family)